MHFVGEDLMFKYSDFFSRRRHFLYLCNWRSNIAKI